MTDKGYHRKLTAILSADVVGYSRLMGEDEAETVTTLTTYRKIMGEMINQHRGRVIDSPGDNILAEFASVVDAVQCAVAAQNEFKAQNAARPEDRRMEFRIGVNLGDVIEEEGRIYGDGVNIAARLEALADPGGICISKTAFDHIETKLPLGYEYLGDQTVKNIKKPVGAYKVLMEPRVTVAGKKEKAPQVPLWRHKPVVAGAIVVLLVIISLVVWNIYFRPPPIEPASEEKMAYPLPEKPSIAVLPFVNMSEDKGQEFFCDGITEEIITALSKTPKMFVIARNSTFTYKGKAVKVNRVAEELGVRYVLEGSVRNEGDRVRITAQLIDALTGHHLWAERYDRDLKDIFALQDEITLNILQTLQVKLAAAERYIAFGKGTENLQAYLKILEAREHARKSNKEGYAMAGKLAEEAISLDPNYPGPYLMLSAAHLMEIMFGTSKAPKQSLKTAEELVQKALALDDHLAEGYAFLGRIYTTKRQYEKAVTVGQKACDLAPNSSFVHAALGFTLRNAGRPEEAIPYLKKAIRLNPFPPAWYLASLGGSYYALGRYEEAVAEFKKSVELAPESVFSRLGLTAAYSSLGYQEQARAEAAEILRLDPKFTLASHAKGLLYKNKADTERYIAALRKAGLPETPPLPLPDKPSIAVLPFVNMSGDPEQEYFSDGITEEIINALSKSSHLFVIARESTFSYKGKQVKVQQIARELGVRYILEGSVRKSEDRVRITAQLIDGIKGQHLWSERYDRALKDIFALQDEITMKIVTALRIKLTEGEQARMWGKKHNKNLDVYLKSMEALELWRKGTKESHIRQGQVAQELIEMASDYGIGYRILAWYNWYLASIGTSPRESIGKAFKLAQKALSLDESDAYSHALLGSIYLMMRKYEKAIAAGERSIELDPNGAMAHGLLGMTLCYADRPDEAIVYLKQGIRLNPFPAYWYFLRLGQSYIQKGQYKEALTAYKKAIQRAPDSFATHAHLAVTYVLLHRQEEAVAAAKKVLEQMPNFSGEKQAKAMPFKNQDHRKLFFEAWHKAGLPE
jgi:adenylate cyclase